ncbi:MAG: hypothetical protein ACRAVC_01245 [Trichormus sp.]
MNIRPVYFLSASIILGTFFGCALPQEEKVIQTQTPPLTSDAADNSDNSSQLPATKAATISIEGEKTPIILKLYEEYKSLFITYFPDQDFVPEGVSSGEGTGVKFIVNFDAQRNENAYIRVFFPNNIKTIAELETFVNSQSGLIASNKWRVISRSSNVSYPWAKQKIDFRQGQDITGTIYLGEQNDKVFYVINHYPAEYADGFAPRSDLILQNLQVN